MKTFEELFNEIVESDELKQEFAEAAKTEEGVEAFLKKHDCPATLEDVKAFLQARAEEAKDLNDADLAAVAGGDDIATALWIGGSILTFGACALVTGATAAYSAINPDGRNIKECVEDYTGIETD